MTKDIFTKIIFGAIIFLIGLTLAVPLIVGNDFFFPFIFPKALTFRVLVEVIFVLYFLLAYLSPEFRPKFNWLFGLLAGFITVAFVAAIFGINFYTSFWGDIERSEGLILWLHLLAYFLVLISVLREKHWLWLFNYSLIIGLIVSLQALAQAFNLGFINSGGSRVTAMFGNASFLAAYMIFQLALAAFLFLKRQEMLYRIIYALLGFLYIFVIINTQTRGAFMGLVAAALVGGALLIFYRSADKRIKIAKIVYVSLIILTGVSI